ncbi:MAG: hypothetical protein QOE09_2985 [Ilumatobacteraceae bacterium]
MEKFQIFRRPDKQYAWHLKSGNGRIIATHEGGFKRKSNAKRSIDAVKKDARRARIEDTTNAKAATTRSAAAVTESTGLDTLTTYLQSAVTGQLEDAWKMFTVLYQGLGDDEDGGVGVGFSDYDDFVSFWEMLDGAGIESLVSSEPREDGARRLLANVWYGGSANLPRQDELVEVDVIVDDDGDYLIDRYFIIEPDDTNVVDVVVESVDPDAAPGSTIPASSLQR